MNDDQNIENLVKIALHFRGNNQNIYNQFYELCKENFAHNIFDFANAWTDKKRELVEKGENK